MTRLVLTSGLILVLAGCGSSDEKLDEGYAGEVKLSSAVDAQEEGGVEPDLSTAKGMDKVRDKPRRYGFTLAVFPLFTEWSTDDKQKIYKQALKNPIPFVEPQDILTGTQPGKTHRKSPMAWDHLEGRDSAEEEMAILEVFERKGEVDKKTETTPATTYRPGARKQRLGYRGRRVRVPSRRQPPEPRSKASGVATISTMTYSPPSSWRSISHRPKWGKVISGHSSPRGRVKVYAAWEPRTAYIPATQQLKLNRAVLGQIDAKRLKRSPLIKRVALLKWSEIDGHPAVEVQAVLEREHTLWLWYVFTADRVFTLSVIALQTEQPAVDDLFETVRVEGRPIEMPESETRSGKDKGRRGTTAQQEQEGQEIDKIEGLNFPIEEEGYQKRMGALLQQFGVFERTIEVQLSDSEKRSLKDALVKADRQGADFVMVSRLRRNKVSYMGLTGPGSFAADFLLWLLFWWPSDFWPGIKHEDWRADVELLIEIYDVRALEEDEKGKLEPTKLWEVTYRQNGTLQLSTPERGWFPGAPVFMRMFHTEGQIVNAGQYVRPRTWMNVERQIIADLHAKDRFKSVLDAKDFRSRINDEVREVRRTGLVVGVREYGAGASGVLTELGEKAYVSGVSASREKKLREVYRPKYQDRVDTMPLGDLLLEHLRTGENMYDQPDLTFGMRPFAVRDAERIKGFLLGGPGFNPADVHTLIEGNATRINLKAALRKVAKARKPDPLFIYLNLETLVVDDPTQPGDELKKYLLPHDVDLETLYDLKNKLFPVGKELDKATFEKRGKEFSRAAIAHLDEYAISFNWLTATFNQDGIEDHRHLNSEQVMLVLDCAFPSRTTGLTFAPIHDQRIEGGWTPTRGAKAASDRKASDEPLPDDDDDTPGDDDDDKPGDDDDKPGDDDDDKPVDKPRQPRWVPAPPMKRDKPRWIGNRDVVPTTVFADTEKDKEEKKKKKKRKGPTEPQLTDDFLQELARVEGRVVVVTGRLNDVLLEVMPKKFGGFAYHFVKGGQDPTRVPEQTIKGRKVVDSRALLKYTREKIEDESRTLNQPQSILEYANISFPVIKK